MKKKLVLLFVLTIFISCKNKVSENTHGVNPVKENIPAFYAEVTDEKIKDLPVKTQDDTVSYALGVAWSNGISKIGLNKVSPSFYFGVHDFIVKNKTFTNAREAGERLDREIEFMKKDSSHFLNADQKLADIKMESKYDTLSYQLAYTWTRGAQEYGIDKVTPVLLLGLLHGLQGDTVLFNYIQADKYLRGHIEKKRNAQFSDIKIQNERWLSQNKERKGIVTLPSGVQYKIIEQGRGRSPKADEVVVCHYIAKLIDNTKIEDTYADGAPLKAMPSGVIPAWREVLPLMKTASKWELYVPYNLAYGSSGIKNKVPPFATLIYEIELIGVEEMK